MAGADLEAYAPASPGREPPAFPGNSSMTPPVPSALAFDEAVRRRRSIRGNRREPV
jgi:hypothetical protein